MRELFQLLDHFTNGYEEQGCARPKRSFMWVSHGVQGSKELAHLLHLPEQPGIKLASIWDARPAGYATAPAP